MIATLNHKQIASQCFNKVWDLLDMNVRTNVEEEQMIHLAHTSFWHWTQVEDHTPTNLSIGYWQISRVYAVVGNGDQALFYANRCIEVSLEAEVLPFYIGYGYEAQARAYKVLKQQDEWKSSYQKAMNYVEKMVNEESKQMLLKDLNSLIE
jgi:hypothetical protein